MNVNEARDGMVALAVADYKAKRIGRSFLAVTLHAVGYSVDFDSEGEPVVKRVKDKLDAGIEGLFKTVEAQVKDPRLNCPHLGRDCDVCLVKKRVA